MGHLKLIQNIFIERAYHFRMFYGRIRQSKIRSCHNFILFSVLLTFYSLGRCNWTSICTFKISIKGVLLIVCQFRNNFRALNLNDNAFPWTQTYLERLRNYRGCLKWFVISDTSSENRASVQMRHADAQILSNTTAFPLYIKGLPRFPSGDQILL